MIATFSYNPAAIRRALFTEEPMRFTKMHGAGNDYVYVSAFDEELPDDVIALARRVSDRHTGIGGDGLIVIGPSTIADARMRIWNADGSEAEMCGNGLRGVAKHVYERGPARNPLRIETGRGVLTVELQIERGTVRGARVNMGHPILARDAIPTVLPGAPPVLVALVIDGVEHRVTCVSMGNPHCVIFTDQPDELVHSVGSQIERHPAFPRRTNVEFVRVESPSRATVRVWERGSGPTQACGTGACAVAVAGGLAGLLDRRVTCAMTGGDLTVEWTASGEVFLSGPIEEVFRGEIARDALTGAHLQRRVAAA